MYDSNAVFFSGFLKSYDFTFDEVLVLFVSCVEIEGWEGVKGVE